MKTIYLELNMGAAGDMLLAALLELLPDREAALEVLNNAGIPGVRYSAISEMKCGIMGTRAVVEIDGIEEGTHVHTHEGHEHSHTNNHHDHRGLSDIVNIIINLNVSEAVKKQAADIYALVADAESKVHGVPVELIHFHEVGAMDAVADIVGVCILLDILKPQKIIASPVTVGYGQVKCAHGILPVPAPATMELLTGIPIKAGDIEAELCTPTGAALLKYFADEFADMPAIIPEKTGYGCGKKEFKKANAVRAILGKAGENAGEVAELSCNLDDMTGEDIGFASEILLDGGALDVWTAPVYMKKNRPGVLLSCLCSAHEADKFAELMLTHTTTIGVRKKLCSRYVLHREQEVRKTSIGDVRFKISHLPDGTVREKPEYEDISRIAKNELK